MSAEAKSLLKEIESTINSLDLTKTLSPIFEKVKRLSRLVELAEIQLEL